MQSALMLVLTVHEGVDTCCEVVCTWRLFIHESFNLVPGCMCTCI